jgi:hypothetical protein
VVPPLAQTTRKDGAARPICFRHFAGEGARATLALQ